MPKGLVNIWIQNNIEMNRGIGQIKNTNLLAVVALSFELGAVTRANSQPVVPLVWLGATEVGCSTAINIIKNMNLISLL